MTKISITATASIEKGPRLNVGADLEASTYHVGGEVIDAGDTVEIDLLPAGGTVSFLALTATGADGKPAPVTITPSNAAAGDPFDVTGSLLVANAGVLAALVTDGPRKLTVENTAATATTVSVIAAVAE